MSERETITLSNEEAKRIANHCEMLYYDTKESAYDATDERAAKDAMMLRDRLNANTNPELLDDTQAGDGDE